MSIITRVGKGAPLTNAEIDANFAEIQTLKDQVGGQIAISAIIDNLTSIATDAPLSANQGRILKQGIDNLISIVSSNDLNLDEIQEIVDFIKANRATLDALSVSNIAGLQNALDLKANATGDYPNLRARATTAADVGLPLVNNTADADKPVSGPQQIALDLKVDKETGKGLSTNDFTAALLTKLNGIAAGAQVNVATNLGYTTAATNGVVTSSTGTNATIPVATTTLAGLQSAADKVKLDGIAAGAQVNVATNISTTPAASTVAINSSTGSNATMAAATATLAGVMTAADKSKLDGIAAGAQVNVATNLAYTTAASNGVVTSSTGNSATIPAATTALAGLMTGADKTKLDGIAAGAQVNVATNLSVSGTGNTRTIASSTGTNATITFTAADVGALPIGGGNMTGDLVYRNIGTGGWARGLSAYIQSSGAYAAGIGFLGSGDSLSAAYLGIGASPWASGNGIRVTATGVTISGATTFDTLITGSVNGNAATATTLQTARTINGVSFNGSANITITAAANGGTSAACSGNAATATALQTARTINDVNFDGSANITVADSTKLPLTGGTLTGVLAIPAGTVAVPGICFSNDTDTGIYRSGTDTLAISTAGSMAVSFDAVGNTNVYGRLRSTGSLVSSAWTTTGCSFDLSAATFTDSSSAAAAVVATRAAATINTPTFASTNAITVTNAATLYVSGRPTAGTNTTITSGWALWINSGDSRFGGNITATANITAYSDIRLKANIHTIPDALAKVLTLRGVTYDRIDCDNERQTGLIAQEVQAVLPEAVRDDGEHLSVAYGNVVGLLVQAIKELKTEIDALKAGRG